MKTIIIIMAMGSIILASCNSGSDNSKDLSKVNIDSMKKTDILSDSLSASNTNSESGHSIKSIAAGYFDLKNALTNDDGKKAADAGKIIVATIDKMDTSQMSSGTLKVYNDLSGDIRENAEHIGANPDKIKHQREHFEMLSKDMYDLLKSAGVGMKAYRDFCPMYNKGKGAYWVSETKEIKNPYLGKKMQTCGSVKAELN